MNEEELKEILNNDEKPKKGKHKVYKIEEGDVVVVYRNDRNGRTYYNVMVTQKQYDNTTSTWYRPVAFTRGVELENQTKIKIKKMFENLRQNKNDKYNPITTLMILDFDIIDTDGEIYDKAIETYNNELQDDDLPW